MRAGTESDLLLRKPVFIRWFAHKWRTQQCKGYSTRPCARVRAGAANENWGCIPSSLIFSHRRKLAFLLKNERTKRALLSLFHSLSLSLSLSFFLSHTHTHIYRWNVADTVVPENLPGLSEGRDVKTPSLSFVTRFWALCEKGRENRKRQGAITSLSFYPRRSISALTIFSNF